MLISIGVSFFVSDRGGPKIQSLDESGHNHRWHWIDSQLSKINISNSMLAEHKRWNFELRNKVPANEVHIIETHCEDGWM